ncbi:MAG: zinc ribbon domain-containing protein [Acidobacteriia bacterium]|nr:zinc ribbon domain-containing protein [Terriglobia bacterium]
MLLGIAIVMLLGLAVFVAAPLLSAQTSSGTLPVDVTPLGDLKRRRLVVYENLKDLEFEYQSGKIDRQDYESLKTNYLGEAAALMATTRQAEELKEKEAVIEREVTARRALRRQPRSPQYVCLKCGFENPVPVKFCGECGARIAGKS